MKTVLDFNLIVVQHISIKFGFLQREIIGIVLKDYRHDLSEMRGSVSCCYEKRKHLLEIGL